MLNSKAYLSECHVRAGAGRLSADRIGRSVSVVQAHRTQLRDAGVAVETTDGYSNSHRSLPYRPPKGIKFKDLLGTLGTNPESYKWVFKILLVTKVTDRVRNEDQS